MPKSGKKYREIVKKIDKLKKYDFQEGIPAENPLQLCVIQELLHKNILVLRRLPALPEFHLKKEECFQYQFFCYI